MSTMATAPGLLKRILLIRATALWPLLVALTAQAAVPEIKTLYQRINDLVEKKGAREIALFAEEHRGRVEWRRVVGHADQDSFDKSDFRARVYWQETTILMARIETASKSGDWNLSEEYYFYPHGRTAFYFRTLSTFQGYDNEHDRDLPKGPYIVEERRYYDEAGREIRHLEKAFVQQTKQAVPVKYIRTNLPIELYADAKALPFYRALTRESRK